MFRRYDSFIAFQINHFFHASGMQDKRVHALENTGTTSDGQPLKLIQRTLRAGPVKTDYTNRLQHLTLLN